MVHFLHKGRDVSWRAVRIQRSVTDEDPRVDCTWLRRLGRRQAAVHADDAHEREAAAGQLEDRHAAETVAHGRDAPINEWVRRQHVDSCLRPSAEATAIRAQFCNARHHALAIARYAVAVHVAGKHDVPLFREGPRARFGVGVESGAAMDDEDSRSPAWPCFVADKHARQRRAAVPVANLRVSQ